MDMFLAGIGATVLYSMGILLYLAWRAPVLNDLGYLDVEDR